MKKIILFMILSANVSAFAGTYEDMADEIIKKIPAKDRTKTLAVMPFSSDEEFSSDAKIATDEMTKALINAGMTVSERGQIDKLIKEQELQQTGLLSNEDAGEIGQGLGAKYVILGSVVKIDKYGEQGNLGLKISARLVSSSNYKVIAVASGEAAAGDASSRYKRRGPRKAAEYPQFLDVFGGMTYHKYQGNYEDLLGSGDVTVKENAVTGISGGIRYVNENKAFYTSSWEFLFMTRKFENDDFNKRYNIYQLSWIPTLRIPLWTYIPALPDYTSLHFAYAFGFGISRASYMSDGKEEDSTGFGFCSSGIIGLRLGVSDSISIFTEFRYTPHPLNQFVRSVDYDGGTKTVSEDLTGPAVYVGLSLAP